MDRQIKIQVCSELGWLLPFLKQAKKMVPLYRVSKIFGYITPYKRDIQTYGSIIRNGKKYNISLALGLKEKRGISRRYIGSILETLAHELAHLCEWEHTPRHFYLCGKLICAFSKELDKSGIKCYTKTRIKL